MSDEQRPSGTDAVRVERTGHDNCVTVITVDRPHARNAIDGPTATALHEAFLGFDADDRSKVAVLTGSGGTFCAGADLKAIGEGRGNRVSEERTEPGPLGCTRMLLDKPVVAAVEGFAVAGGLELALWADLRVAAADATFGVYCRRWGVPLVDGGTVRLPRLIGQSRSLDMILTGRGVSGEEAYETRLGLVPIRSGETQAGAARFAAGAGRHGTDAVESPRRRRG